MREEYFGLYMQKSGIIEMYIRIFVGLNISFGELRYLNIVSIVLVGNVLKLSECDML